MGISTRTFSIYQAGAKTNPDGTPHQEDSIYPEGNIADGSRVFVVCDGLGGHDDGEVASRVVATTLGPALDARLSQCGGAIDDSDVNKAVDAAYDALSQADTHAARKMGTTMAALVLHQGGYTTAHIGDARVYHICPGTDADATTIVHCTRDHSLVNSQIDSDRPVTDTRHVVTRAMQPNARRTPAEVHTSADLRPGDYFLVCSHGLLEKVDDAMLRYIFSHSGGNDRNKRSLLERACTGSRDNYSALVVHIVDTDAEESKIKDTRNKEMQKSDKSRGGGTGTLAIKLLLALMILLTAIMVIYYAFIHHDEEPPRAGTATDPTVIEELYEPDEAYGYETVSTTRIDDEDVGAGTDEEEQRPEETEDAAAETATTPSAEEPAPTAEPAAEPQTAEPTATGPIINE